MTSNSSSTRQFIVAWTNGSLSVHSHRSIFHLRSWRYLKCGENLLSPLLRQSCCQLQQRQQPQRRRASTSISAVAMTRVIEIGEAAIRIAHYGLLQTITASDAQRSTGWRRAQSQSSAEAKLENASA